MKPKDIEDILYKALQEYESKQETWALEIDDHLKNALEYYRFKSVNEQAENNYRCDLKTLANKVSDRDKAIDNLRGYITFLENHIVELKMNIGDYQD